MRIASDLDNVCVAIIESARSALARDLGIDPTTILDTHIYSDPFTHADPAIAARLRPSHAFWDRPDVLLEAKPLPGSLKALWRLYDAGMLALYVTRRPSAVAALTQAWLDQAQFPPVPVAHVGHTDATRAFEVCKSSACKKHGVTHMIDDHADEAETLSRAGIQVIVIDAPIGRGARQNLLRQRPSILVAQDVAHAVDMLFERARRAS